MWIGWHQAQGRQTPPAGLLRIDIRQNVRFDSFSGAEAEARRGGVGDPLSSSRASRVFLKFPPWSVAPAVRTVVLVGVCLDLSMPLSVCMGVSGCLLVCACGVLGGVP